MSMIIRLGSLNVNEDIAIRTHSASKPLGLPGFRLGLVAMSIAGTSRERPLLI